MCSPDPLAQILEQSAIAQHTIAEAREIITACIEAIECRMAATDDTAAAMPSHPVKSHGCPKRPATPF
jgi:hypothetical protein